ncbi:MAG: DUF721 domain-containing protein [Thiohalobacterales bacterium]|nr:DUF721 domain-containing protein [Thiohalobacterales bacterium]
MPKPRAIKKLLTSGSLSPLLARARALTELDQRLQDLLPPALRPHCHVLSLHDRALILAADSPVWAARLRFHAPKLAKALSRGRAVSFSTVRVRVIPPEKSVTSDVSRTPVRRQGTVRASALRQAAQTVSDPRLKSALLKLSRR